MNLSTDTKNQLSDLMQKYKDGAKLRFTDAKSATDPVDKRMLESGATILTNCYLDLKKLLDGDSGQSDALP